PGIGMSGTAGAEGTGNPRSVPPFFTGDGGALELTLRTESERTTDSAPLSRSSRRSELLISSMFSSSSGAPGGADTFAAPSPGGGRVIACADWRPGPGTLIGGACFPSDCAGVACGAPPYMMSVALFFFFTAGGGGGGLLLTGKGGGAPELGPDGGRPGVSAD